MVFLLPLRTLGDRLKAVTVFGLVGVITALHLLTPMPTGHQMHLHAIHTVLEGLYYLPILMAGFVWGLEGGLLCGATVDVIYALHTELQLGGLLDPVNRGRLLALVIFPVVGGVTGHLAGALKRESRALVEAERQLRRAEMLAALGELSAGLAHEIKNPLAAIRGAAEVLAAGVPRGSRDEEFATILESEVDRLDRVLSEVLEFARPGKPGEEIADPTACTEATFALLRHTAEAAGVRLSLDGGGVDRLVRCPPEAFRQVMLNLSLNALQAMEGRGGALSVRIADRGRDHTGIVVSDTGPGVPPAEREKIFRPFYTTREGGTGLGLSVVAKIVAQCGGTVTVGDADGGGASFTVVLPKAPDGPRPRVPEVIG